MFKWTGIPLLFHIVLSTTEPFILSWAQLFYSLFVESRVPFYSVNLLKPTGHVMHQLFNIQQLYVLPTLYLCVLYLSENKQRLVPLTAQTDWFL
jgi:hypothetical protein